MSGLITEERFVELMDQIPVMSEKLDRVLFALEKIAENGNLIGIIQDTDIPFEFNKKKEKEDLSKVDRIEFLKQKAQNLQNEADAIKEELGF